MTTYFALTIGPIFKTMAMAHETRELWAASYIFSHLMEKLVEAFKPLGDIVLPVKPTLINNGDVRIKPGLFPDRLMIKLNPDSKTEDLVTKVKKSFWGSLPDKSKKAQNFYEKYFHVYSLKIDLSDAENPVQTLNDLLDSCELSPAYVADFDINYVEKFLNKVSSWQEYSISVEKSRFPSVIEIASNDLKNADPLKSVPELEKMIFEKNGGLQKIMNSRDLGRIKKDEETDQTVFKWCFDFALESEKAIQKAEIKKKIDPANKPQRFDIVKLLKSAYNSAGCKKEEEVFRYYHKYMAIVQADGDNLSKAIQALYYTGGVEAVQHISGLLMQFGHAASKEISDFGGIPIYMGGDDLLFFAPARNNNESIFHLIMKIDKLFEEKILPDTRITEGISNWNASITKENRRKPVSLSMSFGISIAYYKYPLWESLETARTNLFEIAKSFPDKNAVSFKVLKHSGQHYEALFDKNWRSYKEFFLALINEVIKKKIKQEDWQTSEKKITFLTSLQDKLDPLRPIIYRLLVGREIDPVKATLLEAFINNIPDEFDREFKTERLRENFFNEGVHKNEGTFEFLKLSFEYLLQLYRDMEDVYGNSNATAEKAVDALYATLRLVQFFIQPDHNEIN